MHNMELTEKTYQLININTGEKHICTKINIDGFDYYVNDSKILVWDYFINKNRWLHQCTYLLGEDKSEIYDKDDRHYFDFDCKKVVASSYTGIIDLPQIVIDEIKEMAYKSISDVEFDETHPTLIEYFTKGYNQHAKTHSNSDEDMILFNEWCSNQFNRSYPAGINEVLWFPRITWNKVFEKRHYTSTELLQIWKAQQPKKVYFK